MNGVLKQRLVGALVLIALGVVFWPVIFVEPRQTALDRTSQVPPMPDYPDREIPVPQSLQGLEGPQPVEMHEELPMLVEVPEAVEEEAVAEQAPEPAPEPLPAKKPTPALDDRGIPIAWVVQVATMSSREKAESLQQKLIDLDYKASVKAMDRGGKQLYRVYIGPRLDKGQAQNIKQAVDRKFRVQSIVARYQP